MRLIALYALCLVACNADRVSEASCSGCTGATLTAADCEQIGRAAGCAHAEVEAAGPGCGACRFTECDDSPECFPEEAPTDAGP